MANPAGSEIAGLSEARADAVRRALRDVFGAREASGFRPISGGVSGAQILRFAVGERDYVLRLEPERIALHHRARGFTSMTAAAAAGAAPRVHFADAVSGVAIMDFVAGRPLAEHPGGPAGLARGLGTLSAVVRSAAIFPHLGDFPEMIAGLLAALAASHLFLPRALDAHADGLARLREALPWDEAALVSSHNDPNPRNILFDGTRLWLVDWELAFRNDPLVDLAIMTFDLGETAALEDILLEAAFGRPPDKRLHARLKVMRLLTRLFYGGVVLENFIGRPRPDANLAEYTPASFRAAIADGRLKSGSQEVAYAFGKMSLTAFVDGLAEPGFEDVLALVKG